jgi:small acid-soluble spore protein N (minor)
MQFEAMQEIIPHLNESLRRQKIMGNPKKDFKHFSPEHIGTQPRGFGGNKGKQMQDKSGKHAQVIQTKGE